MFKRNGLEGSNIIATLGLLVSMMFYGQLYGKKVVSWGGIGFIIWVAQSPHT